MQPSPPLAVAFPLATVETFLLVATRLLAALATSPVLGARVVPGPARIWLGLFLALVLVPVVAANPVSAAAQLSWSSIAGEAVVGALAGFAATLVYTAVQFGAGLLDVQAGFSLASVYDPTFGAAGSTLERFYGAFAALIFFQLNAHYLLLAALQQLFQVVPLGGFSPALLHPDVLAAIGGAMLRIALQLVLPVAGALLLADIALAILARVAPQFNVFAIGLQVKVALALVGLLATLPLLVPRLTSIFEAMASAAVGVVR